MVRGHKVGDKLSEETKIKISISKKGKKRSEEYKRACSIKFKGPGNPNFGNHFSKPRITEGRLKAKYGFSVVPNNLIDDISYMIVNNFPNYMIRQVTGLSGFLILRSVNEKFPDLLQKYKLNNRLYGIGNGNRLNKTNPCKGKTYKEIFGNSEKARARAAITSEWMKTTKNIGKYNKYPSKPQVRLYNFIKLQFSSSVIEFPLKIDKKLYRLDIAVPELKLDVEYDEPYWHNQYIESDIKRDKALLENDWVIIRISGEKELDEFLNNGNI